MTNYNLRTDDLGTRCISTDSEFVKKGCSIILLGYLQNVPLPYHKNQLLPAEHIFLKKKTFKSTHSPMKTMPALLGSKFILLDCYCFPLHLKRQLKTCQEYCFRMAFTENTLVCTQWLWLVGVDSLRIPGKLLAVRMHLMDKFKANTPLPNITSTRIILWIHS